MACSDCVQLGTILKDASACGSSKQKLTSFRIGCAEDIVETYDSTDCTDAYIDDVVAEDPVGNPSPLFAIDVVANEDLDELNDYAFERADDSGEDTYSITPTIKILNPAHQCTFESLKGQDIILFYEIENKSGDFVWRRFKGKVTGITGGLVAGYQVTIDVLNPKQTDKPLFVNFGTAETTETGLDALTNF